MRLSWLLLRKSVSPSYSVVPSEEARVILAIYTTEVYKRFA